MAGFDNDCMYADNADFSTASAGSGSATNGLQTNGQLWVGTSAVNAGGTHINVGAVISPLGTLTIGYVSPNITLDLAGGSVGADSFAMQTGTSPVVPTGAGLVTFSGAVVAAGTNPVRTDGTGANTMTLEVQTSQALAAADATKIGLANFDSASFAVAATGFVTLIASGSFSWVDATSATQAMLVQHGYVTDRGAGVVYTLPATAALGDIIKIVGKLGLATITPNANQQILLGSTSGAVGVTGTAVSQNVGDCIELVAITAGASTVWRADSVIGTWVITT